MPLVVCKLNRFHSVSSECAEMSERYKRICCFRFDTITLAPDSISFLVCARRCFKAHSAEWSKCMRLVLGLGSKKAQTEVKQTHNSLYTFRRQTHAMLSVAESEWVGERGGALPSVFVHIVIVCLLLCREKASTPSKTLGN